MRGTYQFLFWLASGLVLVAFGFPYVLPLFY
ncbi:hypothetical protein [Methylohalobius crimeensis]|nr:hypothetical protein [Methylohalobius crimeensis]